MECPARQGFARLPGAGQSYRRTSAAVVLARWSRAGGASGGVRRLGRRGRRGGCVARLRRSEPERVNAAQSVIFRATSIVKANRAVIAAQIVAIEPSAVFHYERV